MLLFLLHASSKTIPFLSGVCYLEFSHMKNKSAARALTILLFSILFQLDNNYTIIVCIESHIHKKCYIIFTRWGDKHTGGLVCRAGALVYRVVFSTAAFHARARGSFAGLGSLKETKMFFPHPLVKLNIVGSSEVACSASVCQSSNFKSRVWRAVLSHSSHHPQAKLGQENFLRIVR